MGASNISSIGKIFMQSQSADVNGSAKEEDLKVAFTEVMSQMTALAENNLAAGNQMMDTGKNSVTMDRGVSGREQDRYQYREMDIRKSTGVNHSDDQVAEKMDTFAEGVKEVLKEELGVLEEQIEEAMETLGLTFADLLNPNQLAALVAELTGTEDVSTLLLSGEFMTILQSAGELGENLLKELGISAEELTKLLQTAQNQTDAGVSQADELAVSGELTAEGAVRADALPGEDTAETTAAMERPEAETAAMEQEAETAGAWKSTAVDEQDQKDLSEEETADAERVDEAAGKAADTTEKQNSAASSGQTSDHQNANAGNDGAAVANQNVMETSYAQNAEGVTEFSSQLDVSDIVRQIVEYSKVTLGNTETTMELQLNPEHLGRIYLEITSKEGVVSARITAQNEIVKEALESQIAELKQNMNQAGVKVDAVEVTVGSHEFEKNLEQNAKQDERQAEEQEKAAKQTRRINLNELDELSGLMTEEESLVAQMMADQGNSVDFTA